MSRASRVTLAPPQPWDDERLLGAARLLELPDAPLWPGDEVGGLVVERVEPQSGAPVDAQTPIEIMPYAPRAGAKHALIVLLDQGASMGQPWGQGLTRADAARYALGVLLPQLDDVVAQAEVHTFSRELRRLGGPAAPSTIQRPPADDVRPSGASRLGGAIDLALGGLAAQRDARATILVLTDSVGEPEAVQTAAQRAARLRVPVHVAAFAPEDDAELVDLARRTGGTFTLAAVPPTLASVAAALAESLGRPRAWREPTFPRVGEPAHDQLIAKEAGGALSRFGLRQEKKNP